MRKTVHYIILFVVACMLLAACGRRATDAERLLARIDSLADVNPDSADILLSRSPLLRALGSAAFRATAGKEGGVRGGSDKARILLRIKTDDKLYRPVTHYRDTILQLIDYFEHHPKVLPSLLGSTGPALPYLYAGRIFADLGDAPQALDYYQRALDAQPAEQMENGEWEIENEESRRLAKQRGLLYSLIGTLFSYQDLYEEAIPHYIEANRWAELAKDTLDIIFNLRDIAEQYKFLHIKDSSLSYYKEGLEFAQSINSSRRIKDIKEHIASLLIENGDYLLAKKYIQSSLDSVDTVAISAVYNIASKIFRYEGKTDSALFCYNKLLEYGNIYGKCNAHRELSNIAIKSGDVQTACNHFQQYKLLDDSIQKRDKAETVARMHASYNYQKHANEAQRLKEDNGRMRLWLLLLALTLVSVLATLLIVFISRRYRKQLRKSNLSKLELLRLSHEQFSAERELQAQSEIRNSAIYETIQRCIKEGNDQTLTDEEWDLLSQTVNKAYKNFEDKLLGLVALNEQDYRICLLIKTNIKPIHIAQLTARSPEAISSSRRRLYERVTNTKGKPQDWDAIVHLL